MTAPKKKPARSSTSSKPTQRSFVRSPNDKPFFVFKTTRQTVYWTLLCLLVLALGIWVMSLNVKIQRLYDQIDLGASQTIITGSSAYPHE
jgi:hypothetical protein